MMKIPEIMYSTITRTPVIGNVTSPKQRCPGILRLRVQSTLASTAVLIFDRLDPMVVSLEDLARPASLSVLLCYWFQPCLRPQDVYRQTQIYHN